MRRWTYCIVAFLATGPTLARAEDASFAHLRAELANLSDRRPPAFSPGTLTSVAYTLDTSEQIENRLPQQSAEWRERAKRYLRALRSGQDPYPLERGQIVPRGYKSALSMVPQGYAVYIPPTYDPKNKYPLMLVLHGGSSNGNLFLGVVLGNNLNWKDYPRHLYDDFKPQWTPDWIVVAPTGFGQVLWRWMGEQDVLDVLKDVQKHYSVDHERVVLAGLSNGGLGAYSIGMRHASRFSVVMAMAGAPGWHQYAGASRAPAHERALLAAVSGYDLAENAFNTDFRFYHGRTDTGPMRPGYVADFEKHLNAEKIPHKATWYDLGHDILYAVHRHGKVFGALASIRRKQRPHEVWLVSGDYRASCQHWLCVTRFESYPQLARIRGKVESGTATLTTHNTLAASLDLRQMPIPSKSPLRLVIDGQSVYSGSVVPLGHVLHVVRRDGRWQLGFPQPPSERTDSSEWEKSKGLSGPITDAYFGAMVHVYGTQKPADTEALKKAAEKGAKGWPLWLWDFEQPVVKDTDVTDAIMRDAHVVLYATPGSNRVLERILGRLPITIDGDAVVMAQQRYTARGVGTRFIFPNPLNPKRYVIVQAAPDTDGVMAGHRLPDFVADYVIYDANATRVRPRLIAGNGRPLASGFFDRFWRVPGAAPLNRNPASPEPGTVSALPIPPAPPAPPKPEAFLAPKGDPAGTIARKLADRVYGFPNFRAEIPGATWTLNLGARWDVRRARQCLRSLHQHGVVVVSADQPPTPVPTPVEVTGAVGGVTFHSMHPDRPVILACEMADRLPILAGVLRKHGVSGAEVMSSYRETPKVSFHTLGLALDLAAFHTRRQTLSVAKHFERTPAYETCRAPEAHRREGQSLLDIACAIAETGHFSSVLTPNYNTGHKDHFHLDARPHDPRLFVR